MIHINRQNIWDPTGSMHNDFSIIKELVYNPCHLQCGEPTLEEESAEYGASTFNLGDLFIKFRIAKTTPRKVGQFVTLWKRIVNGPIQPYDMSDPINLFIITTRKDQNFGHFIFPKSALRKNGVLSMKGEGGKRAIRVYPPWEKNLNRQAQKAQEWQKEFFLEIPLNGSIDYDRAKHLYSI